MRHLRNTLVLAASALFAGLAQATVVYNSWSSNDASSGNYIVSVSHVGSSFNWSLTVSPWNAEALGLFVDLGAVSVGAPAGVNLSAVSPVNQVQVYATDTASNDCGSGCNLNGLSLPALGGGDWELVFRLADQGYDGIQTFSWTTQDFGLGEADLGVIGIRAQQLCDPGQLLPDGQCGGSDKSVGNYQPGGTGGTGGGGSNPVPEPGTLALVCLGLLAAGRARQGR